MSIRKTVVILCLLFCSTFAFGADLTITVIDGDLGIPLEGARIVSWDGKEFLCDAKGQAVLDIPGDRQVIIRISYPGYESSRAALSPGTTEYTAALRLGGVMEARELVIEAPRPGSSETVSGRSVAISGRELARQAETGFVEDVMRAIKLLPGVGYVGGYMAMPSVRGGEPEDITAVYDGFYVEQPFHWGGAFSIFDPKMVESAQLSHGVFSARYGHTVSGLLDIHAKKPSSDTAEVNLAVSSSASNLHFSLPLGNRGGLALMGRVTYWDPFVETAKLFFEEVKYITKAPYIRSSALGLSYDFSTDLSLMVNGFFGGDGVAAYYEEYTSKSAFDADFAWDNKIGFLTSTLSYTPRQNLLLKTRLGAGLLQSDLDGKTHSENIEDSYEISIDDRSMFFSERTTNVQGRFDLDWDWGKGIVFSAGLEERYSRWDRFQRFARVSTDDYSRPRIEYTVLNHGLFSSLYLLLEYKTENNRFGMEAGLRGDHFFLAGDDFALKGIPVANPRINFDFSILEDRGMIDALTLTAGTGLFSSVNSALQNITGRDNIDEFAATQNRSWTNVVGTKVDFTGGYTFTLEGYIKYVFTRAYTKSATDEEETIRWNEYFFDGQAFIWGFDCMLQKFTSRYWDGWISYSYINAKYRDPESTDRSRNSGDWYYPSFHRFHTLNVIFNYKPVPAVNLNVRFSLASGIPIPKTEAIVHDKDNDKDSNPDAPPPWTRIQVYDDMSRAGLVIPLDVKLSFFNFNKNGKVQREWYLSFENLLSLVYTPGGRKDFDPNTGRELPAYSMVSYDLPIPLLTFGIKWSY